MFYIIKRIKAVSICLLFVAVIMMTGCEGRTDENGSKKAEDGRKYGGEIEGTVGKAVSTAFFDMTIEEPVKYETFQFSDGLFRPEEGNTYLVVTFTLKNTYGTKLSMSITDFVLDYDGADKSKIIGFGKSELGFDDYMESTFTLNEGEKITKKILYTVPDKEEYTIRYNEFYEDKFSGNSFYVPIKPIKKIEEDIENTEAETSE